jgi:hypothetical protein
MTRPNGENPLSRQPARPSYRAVISGPLLVVVLLGSIAWTVFREPVSPPRSVPVQPAEKPPVVAVVEEPKEEPPAPEPEPVPEPPQPDRERIAEAEAELAAARKDRESAEARLKDSEVRLQEIQTETASAIESAKVLGSRIEDPSARIEAAKAKGDLVRAERDKVQAALVSLANRPRPRRKPLIDKSPVARPAKGEEHHFEIHRDRIAFINLPRLMDEVRLDARVQLRMAGRVRPIGGRVGPVGDFSIEYEMMPDGFEVGMGSASSISYSLSGWEIVPTQQLRGETLRQAMQPASDFSRALTALQPEHDTITLWVYPDGFALYRQVRDLLHERGFLVAARPLPDGTPIRGSPSGSVSAGQ